MADTSKKHLLDWMKENPGDAATLGGIVVVVVLATLGILGAINLSQGFISGAAITLVGALVISLSVARIQVNRMKRELSEVKEKVDNAQAHVMLLGAGAQAVEVTPKDIPQKLDDLLNAETGRWYFRGGLGSWQRRTVLPHFQRKLKDGPYLEYFIQIIDPSDDDLCRRYAMYRETSRQRAATREEVLSELLSYVYAAAWYARRARVRARVALLSSFSPLRYDISDGGLVVSVADTRERALHARPGGWYYKSVLDEIDQAHSVAPQVQLPSDDDLFPFDWRSVSESHVREMLFRTNVYRPMEHSTFPLISSGRRGELDFSKIAEAAFRGRKA